MLRVLWGDSSLELAQQAEILRLRAEVTDLREKHIQTAQKAARDLQQAYDGFISFLRPQTLSEPSAKSQQPTEWPGDRPSTEPPRPIRPPWADDDVLTAVPV